jgi:hypothetical protein
MRLHTVAWPRLAALILGATVVPSCDCFFDVQGSVVECGTTTPLAGVTIDLMIDKGYDDRKESFPGATTTDAKGRFEVGANDPCDSWGTLTLRKDGFVTLVPPQFKGSPPKPVQLCMTRMAAP